MGGVRHPQIRDAVDTVVCAPDDGWWYHPKHVEQFPYINKLCKVASCWTDFGIFYQYIFIKWSVLKIVLKFALSTTS